MKHRSRAAHPTRAGIRAIAILLCPVLALFAGSPALAEQCAAQLLLEDEPAAFWTGWGNGPENRRAAGKGLDSSNLDELELRWAFGFDGAGSAIGNPVVHGDVLFTGSEDGTAYALDADTGCEYWRFRADDGVRTAPSLGKTGGRWLLFFGDRSAQVYALDAHSGRQLWRTRVEQHPAAILTGAPQFFRLDGESPAERLLVPVSSSEEGLAAVPGYRCCSFRGSVVSLDAADGSLLWQSHTIRSPVAATGENSAGPSGAAIWSAPTLDAQNRRFFVTTGDAYSAPADIATDAVIGMDLLHGDILWINQGTSDDIWTVRCLAPDAPAYCGPDQDYGSPAMLFGEPGKRFLVAGQKSGVVRAFSARGGSLLWRSPLVENPDEFGGKIVWGGAGNDEHVYFGLGTGGIAALRLADGAPRWFTPLPPATGRESHSGQDGSLSLSGDLLISGGWDGMLRILSGANGRVLWQYDTVRDFESVNGVAARGGSIGAVGPVVAGGRVFVSSGYVGVKNGMQGNVLLMFSPR